MSNGPPLIFMVFFAAIFVVIFGSIAFIIIKGIVQWSSNNQQPVLTVPVKVVSKREDVSVSSHYDNSNLNFPQHHTRTITTYYATFEFDSGDRKEFEVTEEEYGVIAESDTGDLTFQGTRYKGFHRRVRRQETASPVPPPPVVRAPEPPPEPQRPPVVAAPTAPGERAEGSIGYCAACNIEIEGNFKFCPQCGKPLTRRSDEAPNRS